MEKNRLFQRQLEVRRSRLDNFGVFTQESLSRGDIIEECHVIVLGDKHEDLSKYYFDWPKPGEESVALALGYGSIYNHSDYPNATWDNDTDRNVIVFKASIDIQQGQEITLNYGKAWFEAREIYKRKASGLRTEAVDTLLIGHLD